MRDAGRAHRARSVRPRPQDAEDGPWRPYLAAYAQRFDQGLSFDELLDKVRAAGIALAGSSPPRVLRVLLPVVRASSRGPPELPTDTPRTRAWAQVDTVFDPQAFVFSNNVITTLGGTENAAAVWRWLGSLTKRTDLRIEGGHRSARAGFWCPHASPV